MTQRSYYDSWIIGYWVCGVARELNIMQLHISLLIFKKSSRPVLVLEIYKVNPIAGLIGWIIEQIKCDHVGHRVHARAAFLHECTNWLCACNLLSLVDLWSIKLYVRTNLTHFGCMQVRAAL